MPERTSILSTGTPARVNLRAYSAELPLGTLAVGVDNIHHDVFLSPTFMETTEAYLLEFIRQTANLTFLSQTEGLQSNRRQPPRRAPNRGSRLETAALRSSASGASTGQIPKKYRNRSAPAGHAVEIPHAGNRR